MIDLTETIVQAQIAFFLAVIAILLFYYVFAKKPTKGKSSKK